MMPEIEGIYFPNVVDSSWVDVDMDLERAFERIKQRKAFAKEMTEELRAKLGKPVNVRWNGFEYVVEIIDDETK